MPRHNRPDPETGLMEIPTEVWADEPLPQASETGLIDYGSQSIGGQLLSGSLATSSPVSTRVRRTFSDGTAEYAQAVDTLNRGGAVSSMAVRVQATRDFARGGVNLSLSMQHRDYEGGAVVDRILWRAVRPGEVAPPSQPLFLDERFARTLSEQLQEFHPEHRRINQYREQRDTAQNELRSSYNQLEEVRGHNTTLVRVNEEQQRQIRWLERELRDANVERRAITTTHS